MIYLPINDTLLSNYSSNCWAFYCYLSCGTIDTYCSFSEDKITIISYLDNTKLNEGRIQADLGEKIWKQYEKTFSNLDKLYFNCPTALMTLTTFNLLRDAILTLPKRSRNNYFKFYLTVYFMCHTYHNDCGVSIDRLAEKLGSNSNTICKEIQFFIEHGLLRRMGKFNPELALTYRYFIPIELSCRFK